MSIGKIVKSDSHISYVCQIHGPREVETQPVPADYAFGRFVLIAIRTEQNDDDQMLMDKMQGTDYTPRTYAIGVIYEYNSAKSGLWLFGAAPLKRNAGRAIFARLYQ